MHFENAMIAADHGKVTIAYGYRYNGNNRTWMTTISSQDNGASFTNSTSFDLANTTSWFGALTDLTRSGENVAYCFYNTDGVNGSSYRNAYVSVSTNSGVSFTTVRVNEANPNGWGTAVNFDSPSGGGCVRPKLAWAENSLCAIWVGTFTNESVMRAFLARSTNGGSSFLPPQCLSLDLPAGAGNVRMGHVAVAAKGNYVYAVFNTDTSRVFVKRSTDGGAAFQPIQEMSDPNSPTSSSGWGNVIVADPNVSDGSKVHFFTSDYYRGSSDGGATFSTPVHFSTYYTPGNTVNRAQLAVDTAGLLHFAWDGCYSTYTNNTIYNDWDEFYRPFSPQAPALSPVNQALVLARGGFKYTIDVGGLRRDNMQIPSTPALTFSNAMTVELRFACATNSSSTSKLIKREHPTETRGVFRLQTHATGASRYVSAKLLTTNGMVELWGVTPINSNDWHHVALTFDASTNVQNARLYLDGNLEASANANGFMDTRGGITWVGDPDESANKFQGMMDELRFWNRALSASEIGTRKAGTLTGTEPGLTAYYSFDGSTRETTGHAPDGVLMYQETFVTNTVPNPITDWLAGYGLTGTNASYNADPDHDGLNNLGEYAFSLNPTNAASVAFPAAAVDNDRLILSYRERSGGTGTVGVDYTAGSVTYRVEVANSLPGPWNSGTNLLEQTGSALNNGDGTETVQVRLKQTISGVTQRFMRLVLVTSPSQGSD